MSERKRAAALVTGSSRGIGRAIAHRLALDGWPVCVNWHERRDAAESLVREILDAGGDAIAVGADVSDMDAVSRMVHEAETRLAPVELLVNNAGVAGQCLFQDITDELWNRYFSVNLGGARNAIRAVLPHMLHEKRGCILNISSIWGLRGASCETAYACTKAALIALTRSLALELAPSGIRVNCVAPGVINTDMVQVLGAETLRELAVQTPLGRLGTAEDVADAAAFLCSDGASFVTGQVLCADGGFIV
jgi:3-oxoacyl-[acyl-carrier protein] reductase